MPVAELATLTASVKAHGLLTPITLLDGKILDGRHRYHACLTARVVPTFAEYSGNDPVGFVMAANLERRHLDVGQRAMIAVELETMKHGGDRKSEARNQDVNLHLDREEAAETLGISQSSVAKAAKIKAADPALADEVAAGNVTLNAASKKVAKAKAEAAAPAPDEPEERIDKVGQVIPPALWADWDRAASAAKHLCSLMSEIRCTLRDGRGTDVIFGELGSLIVTEANALYHELTLIKPHAVCTTCRGVMRKKCKFCGTRGWLSDYRFNSFVSKEEKALIVVAAAKKGTK
jgi:hypothetical protein